MFIELKDSDFIITNQRTSKGNQPKWYKDNVWYKADYMGYEALSEIIVSRLLEFSDIDNFVRYYFTQIKYNDKIFNGCYSYDFRHDGEIIVPIEKLYRNNYGTSLADDLVKFDTVSDKICHTVNSVTELTGISDFGRYLTALLETDTLFLNEDRHTNNIAVIKNRNTNTFRPAPVFDNGLSLLSDINDYVLDNDIYKEIQRVRSKPFGTDFNEQLEAAEKLYGQQIRFNFGNSDIEKTAEASSGYYSKEIIDRVKNVLYEQKRKYTYFFR